ncbi:MAG: Gp15 family bacteriophage protein [[Clostridium] innocuum]
MPWRTCRSRKARQQAKKINDRVWYDLFEDWELIEASFAMQYPGKDLYDDTMDWKEFITLLAGLRKRNTTGANHCHTQ